MNEEARYRTLVDDVWQIIEGQKDRVNKNEMFEKIIKNRKGGTYKLTEKAMQERLWATLMWPRLLTDKNESLEKRVTFSICLRLSVPKELMEELKDTAEFDELGYLKQVKLPNLDWEKPIDYDSLKGGRPKKGKKKKAINHPLPSCSNSPKTTAAIVDLVDDDEEEEEEEEEEQNTPLVLDNKESCEDQSEESKDGVVEKAGSVGTKMEPPPKVEAKTESPMTRGTQMEAVAKFNEEDMLNKQTAVKVDGSVETKMEPPLEKVEAQSESPMTRWTQMEAVAESIMNTADLEEEHKEIVGEMLKESSNHTLLLGTMTMNALNVLQAQGPGQYNQFSAELFALITKYNVQ